MTRETIIPAARETVWIKLRGYLWPETPLIFKPALVYLVLILILIPSYRGLKTSRENRIRTLQAIQIDVTRSTSEEPLKISRHTDGLITFVFSDAVAGKSYQLVIKSEKGKTKFRDENFTDFKVYNDYGTGQLLFPYSIMGPGTYHLVISDTLADSQFVKQEYIFRITE